MSEREETIERETSGGTTPPDLAVEGLESAEESGQTVGGRSGLRTRLGSLFSPRQALVAGASALAGFLLLGTLLPLGSVGSLLGIAAGSFVFGAVSSRRRYLEAAVAGGVVGSGAALLDYLVLTLAGVGLPIVAVSLVAGTLAGLLGHYFGRDLRDGLTRDL
jgi:hypothetical protein